MGGGQVRGCNMDEISHVSWSGGWLVKGFVCLFLFMLWLMWCFTLQFMGLANHNFICTRKCSNEVRLLCLQNPTRLDVGVGSIARSCLPGWICQQAAGILIDWQASLTRV